MTFGESIKTVFKKYAEFEGTASRSEYWWFALFTFLVSIPFNIFSTATENVTDPIITLVAFLVALVYFAISMGILVPSLAVTVRRLRDAGYHWAWIFISLVPIAGWIALIVFLASPSKVAPVVVNPAAPQPPTPPTAPVA